jgi:hypothetical protein
MQVDTMDLVNVKFLKEQKTFLLLEILFHFNVLMQNLD